MRQFGWQDIVFPIPDGWDLSRVEGNAKKGYLRLDDSSMPRIELRWDASGKKTNIKQVADNYVANLKKAKKTGSAANLSVRRNLRLEQENNGTAASSKYEFFTWEKDLKAHCFIRHCGEC